MTTAPPSPVRAAATKWLEAAEKATKPPWRYERGDIMPSSVTNGSTDRYFPSVYIGSGLYGMPVNQGGGPMEEHEANGELIALSRLAIPAAAKALLVLDEAMERVCAECIDPGVVLILSHARQQAASLCGEVAP